MRFRIQTPFVSSYISFLSYFFLYGTSYAQLADRANMDHAIFFAANAYQGMDDLKNPIQNAREMAKALKEGYGYQTEVVENPTFEVIESKLKEYENLFRQNHAGQYPYEGQLLIFFSGHGMDDRNVGYFLPIDADPERPYSKGMAYDVWRNIINLSELQERHKMAYGWLWGMIGAFAVYTLLLLVGGFIRGAGQISYEFFLGWVGGIEATIGGIIGYLITTLFSKAERTAS